MTRPVSQRISGCQLQPEASVDAAVPRKNSGQRLEQPGRAGHGQSGRGEGRGRGQRQCVCAVRRSGSGAVHRGQKEASGKENADNRNGE